MDLGRVRKRSADDDQGVRARRLGFGGRRRRGWLTGAALLSGFLAVPLVWGNRVLPVDVPLLDNVAWLPSDAAGEVARVNGETVEVDATLPVPEAGGNGAGGHETVEGDIAVEQADGVVVVQVGDTVRHIDVAQLDWGDSAIGTDGDVVVGDAAVYLVQTATGVVRALNPETLTPSAQVDLEVSLQRPGIVVAGYLVVAGSDGQLYVVAGGRVVSSTPAGVAGDRIEVSQVGDEVVVLNLDAGRVSRFALVDGSLQARGEVDVDVFTGEVVVPPHLPAGKLWVLAPGSGHLVGIDLASGETVSVAVVPEGSAKADVSGPVVARDRVYVVDRTGGRVVEVDAATAEVVDDPDLGIDDASQVDVVVQGDTVFVNDRAGSTALVIHGDEHHEVDKYEDRGPGTEQDDDDQPGSSGTAPSPNQPDPTPPPTRRDDDRDDDRGPSPTAPSTTATPPTVPSTTTTTAPTTTTTVVVPPGAVTGLTPVEGDGGVQLSWNPPATGTPPVTYTVSWTPGGASQAASGPTFSATGLTNDVTYRFTVTARNAAGAGPAAQVDATPRSPVTPPQITYLLAREPNGVGSGNPWEAGMDYTVGSGVTVSCYAEKTGQPATRIQGSCSGSGSAVNTVYIGPFTLAAGECTSFTISIETNVGSDSGTTEENCGAPATSPSPPAASPGMLDPTTTECRLWSVDPNTGQQTCVGG